MPMLPPQPVSMTCPNCSTQFQAQVFQLIDVGQVPEMKQALLGGRINVAVCPNCGAGGMLATPMLYHDPAKQFFFALFPPEVQATPQEQENFIGSFTQFVMSDLPADTPKGYLLTPRRFMSLSTMLDTILEGEGISKEALEAQRRRTGVLGLLLQAGDDQDALRKIADEHKAVLDYEFLLTVAAYMEAAEQDQDEESYQRFSALRTFLIEYTGMDVAGAVGDEEEPDLDTVVDALLSAEEAQLPEVIAEYRPLLDYGFYEALAARIDAAHGAGTADEAERIAARRDLIRTTVERMDQEAQEMFERAANTLQAVLDADDLHAALREHRSEIDEAFLLVVGANAQHAERIGNQEILDKLTEVARLAPEVVQEGMSPEERLIGQLLAAEKPQDATKLLRQNARQINSDFVKRLNDMGGEMETAGRTEQAERLRQLGREAASMLF
jgi:hypothetical protein